MSSTDASAVTDGHEFSQSPDSVHFGHGENGPSCRSKWSSVLTCWKHNYRPGEGFTLPKGDILIHAGDLTNQGTRAELQRALDWITKTDFAVKVVVAGNHDLSLDTDFTSTSKQHENAVPAAEDVEACAKLVKGCADIVYLQHSDGVIDLPGTSEKIRVFGSPCSPRGRGKQRWAFQYDEHEAEAIWKCVPEDVAILITHTPPAGYCDRSRHWEEGGCRALKAALSRIKPVLHVCGHCHEGRGALVLSWEKNATEIPRVAWTWEDASVASSKKQSLLDLSGKSGNPPGVVPGMETAVVNASIMAESFGRGKQKGFHKPIVIDISFARRGESGMDNT
ncbi:Metallophosphoesterase MPPED2 [Lecanosticta acicola]|uniref:Metallophosphoesterase MPPED2 n=1 Tax=Lecanosticta acicola TaxID=111012 RepID=A0AAI9EDN0_9PEZI|nr:Metallophosphoesterase MPPED2 [Lecanosticta acicola]